MSWLSVERPFVCGDTVPWVSGLLGNLSSLPKVVEVTSAMLITKAKNYHANELTSAQNMERHQLSPEPCGLFFQAESLRHNPIIYRHRREKAKCPHTYNLQSVIVAHRSEEADIIFSCEKKRKGFFTERVNRTNAGSVRQKSKWVDSEARWFRSMMDRNMLLTLMSLSLLLYKIGYL